MNLSLTLPFVGITLPLIAVLIITLAFLFDFYNGMHDAANSIATVVATKVLTPFQAVAWAAFFNFAAIFVFGLGVAATIGKGLVVVSVLDNTVILSALVGAIIMAAAATHLGIPLSISHCLIGGLGGVAVLKAGFGALIASGFLKIIAFIFISPVLGYLIAGIFSVITIWIVKDSAPRKVDKHFRKLQIASAAAYSLSHGGNDAQKTMGLITMVLIANKALSPAAHTPYWVVFSCNTVIALGTLFGGWKVIKTLGMKMTKLTPFGGFSAESSASITIFIASAFGVPVSTTHTISGAIAGVGAAKSTKAVRWKVARNIIWAWILTIPLSAAFGMAAYKLLLLINL
ncbi:MAG: anion permease [Bacteroidota bacterium]|jgi:PiT family inorganic phosphate transporter|nr:inorganic phosphate transporter [Ignavibacteria bacterium]MCU7513531.1 inorganic phosphate transporter [Ignavibacteria bacterium]MCU7525252.1 inorganic phosphate transporter [Ignavibacteria bacterium]